MLGVLQDLGALHISAAVQPGGQQEMPFEKRPGVAQQL
jgi:hypothetical protein